MVQPDTSSKERIKVVLKKSSQEKPQQGTYVYIVPLPWYNRLVQWVNEDDKPAPGPVDVSDIVNAQKPGTLAMGKCEGYHVQAINGDLWDTLIKELDSVDGQQPIKCLMRADNKAELYPMDIRIYTETCGAVRLQTQTKPTDIKISRRATVGDMKSKFASEHKIPDISSIALWRFNGIKRQGNPLTDDDAVLEDIGVRNEMQFLAVVRGNSDDVDKTATSSTAEDLIHDLATDDDEDDDDLPDPKLSEWRPSSFKGHSEITYGNGGGAKRNFQDMDTADAGASSSTNGTAHKSLYSSPRTNRGNGYASSATSGATGIVSGYNSLYSMQSVAPGVCGLRNLGNTCFMNSSLQCISNVEALARYFLDEKFLLELNRESPIGCKGELAEAFGALLREMWSGTNKTVAPMALKDTAGKFAPRFQGYQQQDSQEFLEFFLDGLHEDLNRIRERPVVEAVEVESMPDAKAAALAWEIHKLRNDSVIVDLFQGQYKSTLTCPNCEKVSIKFDPYMSLTLPIPNKEVESREIVLIGLTGKRTKYSVLVPKGGSARAQDVHDALLTLLRARGIIGATDNGQGQPEKAQISAPTKMGVLQILSFDGRFKCEGFKTLALEDPLPDDMHAHLMAIHVSREQAAQGTRVVALMVRNTNNGTYTTEAAGPFALVLNNTDTTVPDGHIAPLARADLLQRINTALSSVLTPAAIAATQTALNSAAPSGDAKASGPGRRSFARAMAINEDTDGAVIGGAQINAAVTSVGSHQLPHTVLSYHSGDRLVKLTPETRAGCHTEGEDGTVEDVQGGADTGEPGGHIHAADAAGVDAVLVPSPTSTVSLNVLATTHVRELLQDTLQLKCDTDVSCRSQTDPCDTSSTLDECFEQFQREEVLGADNTWYCPQCKEHQRAKKRMELWTLPDVLIVHLKRFSQDRWHRHKVTTLVDFPFEGLDLGRHVRGPTAGGQHVYELTGVVNHSGYMGGGHYTANARNFESDNWYNFDDSYVMPEDRRHAKTTASYVLFYQRSANADAPQSRVNVSIGS